MDVDETNNAVNFDANDFMSSIDRMLGEQLSSLFVSYHFQF